MKKISLAAVVMCAVIAALYFSTANEKQDQTDPTESKTSLTVRPHESFAARPMGRSSSALSNSPFGRGEPPPPRTQAQRAEARRLIMERNHYSTPPAYFSMTLQELQERAKQRDVFALLQLGEQYWSESEEIADNPSYDKSQSPKQTAIEIMSSAVGQGHSHAATVVASMYSAQGQDTQAYSWMLISERMGDLSMQEQRKSYEAKLNQSQLREATDQADATNAEIQKSILEMLRSKSALQ